MKVLIADDHALFRDGLALFLEKIEKDVMLFQTSNYTQAVKTLESEKDIDLLVIDLDMPDMSWEEGLEQVVSHLGEKTKFFVISASEDVKAVKKCLELGASGYVSKRSDPKILENALKLVMDGGVYLPSEILQKYITSNPQQVSKEKNKGLTERQEQVLKLAASGLSNKQIAYEIGITESTVKLHINSLLRALDANNRTQAVINAQKMGLI